MSSANASAPPRSSDATDVACPFCGLICDDLVIAREGDRDSRTRPEIPDSSAGITLLDHPVNPNHPTVFHVRDDGWMGASLTFDAPRTIDPGTPLKLRYGLWIHSGVQAAEQINAQFDEFAQIGDPPPIAK